MSRLGKLPIILGENTQAKIENGFVIVKGPKGELKERENKLVDLQINDKKIIVSVKNPNSKKEKAFWGLMRSLIQNMVTGVEEGFSKQLEINGVGYKASVAGKKVTLNVGFSHPVEYDLPEGITVTVEKNVITIAGISKQSVGEVAAQLRKVKKPEPYKGKGIKYIDEIIRRKESKTATKSE